MQKEQEARDKLQHEIERVSESVKRKPTKSTYASYKKRPSKRLLTNQLHKDNAASAALDMEYDGKSADVAEGKSREAKKDDEDVIMDNGTNESVEVGGKLKKRKYEVDAVAEKDSEGNGKSVLTTSEISDTEEKEDDTTTPPTKKVPSAVDRQAPIVNCTTIPTDTFTDTAAAAKGATSNSNNPNPNLHNSSNIPTSATVPRTCSYAIIDKCVHEWDMVTLPPEICLKCNDRALHHDCMSGLEHSAGVEGDGCKKRCLFCHDHHQIFMRLFGDERGIVAPNLPPMQMGSSNNEAFASGGKTVGMSEDAIATAEENGQNENDGAIADAVQQDKIEAASATNSDEWDEPESALAQWWPDMRSLWKKGWVNLNLKVPDNKGGFHPYGQCVVCILCRDGKGKSNGIVNLRRPFARGQWYWEDHANGKKHRELVARKEYEEEQLKKWNIKKTRQLKLSGFFAPMQNLSKKTSGLLSAATTESCKEPKSVNSKERSCHCNGTFNSWVGQKRRVVTLVHTYIKTDDQSNYKWDKRGGLPLLVSKECNGIGIIQGLDGGLVCAACKNLREKRGNSNPGMWLNKWQIELNRCLERRTRDELTPCDINDARKFTHHDAAKRFNHLGMELYREALAQAKYADDLKSLLRK